MKQPLLTLEEAAKRLNTSIYSVRRFIHRGSLVGTKIGGEWRVDPVDLEDFIQKNKWPKQDKSQNA